MHSVAETRDGLLLKKRKGSTAKNCRPPLVCTMPLHLAFQWGKNMGQRRRAARHHWLHAYQPIRRGTSGERLTKATYKIPADSNRIFIPHKRAGNTDAATRSACQRTWLLAYQNHCPTCQVRGNTAHCAHSQVLQKMPG